jgi:hypothetical protein
MRSPSILPLVSSVLALSVLSSCSRCGGAAGAGLTGSVVDSEGRPIAGARVRLQATSTSTLTDRSGSFRLQRPPGASSAVIAAWKDGYFNGGEKLVSGRTGYRIVLKAIPRGDERSYAWASPRHRTRASGDERAACEKCHPVLVTEWEQSAHAGSARNPLFLAVFEGKDRSGHPTGAPGFRLDFPRSLGNCAACHVPALAVNAPFATDPSRAQGVAAEGISCDLCHKVRDATVDASGGRPGVLSLEFARPASGRDAFFGPLDDVIAGPDSFRALYRESTYCAPCHHGSFWNVRAYSEFAEWAESSYAKRNVQCQDCHMKLRTGPRRFALEKEGAVVRDPATISSHVQYGLGDEAFMRGAVTLSARADALGDRIRVRVSVRNSGAGHHVPTGSPMRNMVLLVEARDAKGAPLVLVTGGHVPGWAGRGSPQDGDYAGLPGKGFAKVLAELVEYPADPRLGRRFSRADPAPYWRPTVVASDTRIPAEATDESEYVFAAAQGGAAPVTVRTKLVYRRTFRSWGSLDRIKGGDLELASSTAVVPR